MLLFPIDQAAVGTECPCLPVLRPAYTNYICNRVFQFPFPRESHSYPYARYPDTRRLPFTSRCRSRSVDGEQSSQPPCSTPPYSHSKHTLPTLNTAPLQPDDQIFPSIEDINTVLGAGEAESSGRKACVTTAVPKTLV